MNNCDLISFEASENDQTAENNQTENRASTDPCPEAELSDEQKTQIDELRHNVNSPELNLNRENRRIARSNYLQNILETVSLTEEQRVALTNCFKYKRKRRRHRQ